MLLIKGIGGRSSKGFYYSITLWFWIIFRDLFFPTVVIKHIFGICILNLTNILFFNARKTHLNVSSRLIYNNSTLRSKGKC